MINELQNSPPTGRTVGELQNEPMSAWGNDDIITGLKFSATMQLRTPLRVLLRHGEIHTDRNTKPPRIALEPWEGIWLPKVKTFRELGVDIDNPSMGTMASSIGQIQNDGGNFLPFLIAVRTIVESHDSIESRIKLLREMPITDDLQIYVDKLWGIDHIIGIFFPSFISTIPSLSIAIRYELSVLDLGTPNRIAAATDETLLHIKGIGESKLKVIRDYCAGVTDNRDADTVENVVR